jgi:hypothetical protein
VQLAVGHRPVAEERGGESVRALLRLDRAAAQAGEEEVSIGQREAARDVPSRIGELPTMHHFHFERIDCEERGRERSEQSVHGRSRRARRNVEHRNRDPIGHLWVSEGREPMKRAIIADAHLYDGACAHNGVGRARADGKEQPRLRHHVQRAHGTLRR